jgi:hypothetical protein
MPITTYKGTLVDASCAGGSSSAAPPSDSKAASDAKTGGNNAGGGGPACSPSANTTQFGLKLKDGRTIKFDTVGNQRVQEALKNKKKWSDAVNAGKPIRARVDGAETGDTFTVVSVD